MSSKPVVLILGAGPRIGAAVATAFAKSGYSIALLSRKATNSVTTEGHFGVRGDLSDLSSIAGIFSTVQEHFHTGPSVVIYNAAAISMPAVDGDLFSITADQVANDFTTNSTALFEAEKQTVKAWQGMPEGGAKKVFIYTGNELSVKISTELWAATLGMGKSASQYLVGLSDMLYSSKGYRFFYADERNEDGSMKGAKLNGDAAAQFYTQLAKGSTDVPWHATFVKDKGYTKFE